MAKDPSIIEKSERVFDDLIALWRRRKWLCIGLILVLIAPSLVLLADKFWGRSKLSEQITALHSELADTKRDRDAKATQLAPFLAAANQHFEGAPANKRLELLLDRLESVAQIMREATSQMSGKRSLSQEAQKRIAARLSPAPRVPIEIDAPLGDGEAIRLANQIKAAFEGGEFKVNGVNQSVWSNPPSGVFLQCKRPPDGPLLNAFLQLFIELGARPTVAINEGMPESNITIVVGSK